MIIYRVQIWSLERDKVFAIVMNLICTGKHTKKQLLEGCQRCSPQKHIDDLKLFLIK